MKSRYSKPKRVNRSWLADDWVTDADKGTPDQLARLAHQRRERVAREQPAREVDPAAVSVVRYRADVPEGSEADRTSETRTQVLASRFAMFRPDRLPWRSEVERGLR